MTISFVFLLLIAAYLCVKMKGAQWYVLILGAVISRSLTPGSSADNLLAQIGPALQTVVKSVLDSVGGGNLV